MKPFASITRSRAAIVTILLAAFGTTLGERGLKTYYEGGSYGYYQSTEVYLEDRHTLLLYLPHPDLLWSLRPSISLSLHEEIIGFDRSGPLPSVRYDWTLRTDADGFRAHGSDRRRAEIACFGDSRTLGEALRSDATYPAQLEAELGRRGYTKIVANLGHDGWSIDQGARLLEASQNLQPRLRYAIFCFGINDADRAWGTTDTERMRQKSRTFTTIQRSLYGSFVFYWAQRSYLGVLAGLRGGTAAEPILKTEGPRRVPLPEYGRVVRRIVEVCRTRSITPIFLILPRNPYFDWSPWVPDTEKRPIFDLYDDVIVATAANTDIIVADMRPVFEPDSDTFVDDMHLSGTGAAWVASVVANTLEEIGNELPATH